MGATSESVRSHYETSGLTQRVLAALANHGYDIENLVEDDLARIGEFHSAGRAMTVRLAELARVGTGDRVLDVGAGIGGPARYIASTTGASVVALDLVEEFCNTARELNRRTGLSELVEVRRGNATDLRFDDGSFDVVWTQHVAMNIEDKHALYTEFRRVLRQGGRLAFFDVVGGSGEPIHLPVPWASERGQSFLETPEVLRKLVEAAGFTVDQWIDPTDEVIELMANERADDLSIGLVMRDAAEKLATYRRNLDEGRTLLALAVAVAV